MAIYGTDLITLANADDDTVETTWTELATPYAIGGTPANDDENYIQGINCISQTTGTKTGAQFSIVYNAGAPISWTSGWVFIVWQYYAIGANLATADQGGVRIGIHSTLSDGDIFYVGGSDRTPYPAGAWQNVAVDPENTTNEVTHGGGNGGSYQIVGTLINTINAVAKGAPHACDAIRYGRGQLYTYGAGGNFITMAEYSNYNNATAHPNSLDSDGYNRYGLFTPLGGGTYQWKGLMSFGSGSNTSSFSDSNKAILIEDTYKTYAAFNKIEVVGTGSSVSLTNVTFTALGTTSSGQFEMVDNASVTMSSVVFAGMDSFILQSRATSVGSTWRRCNSLIQGTSSFDSCTFDSPTTAESSSFIFADDLGNISNCDFVAGSTGHAIEASVSGSYQWVGNTNSGYGGTPGSNLTSNSGPGNAFFFNNSGGLITLNGTGGSDAPTVRNGAGATTVFSSPVTYTISNLVPGTEVRIYPTGSSDPLDELDGTESSSTTFLYNYEYVGDQYNDIVVHHVDYVYIRLQNVFMGNTNGGTSVQQQSDRWYDNPPGP